MTYLERQYTRAEQRLYAVLFVLMLVCGSCLIAVVDDWLATDAPSSEVSGCAYSGAVTCG